jgi:hypothetical protein
MPRGVDFISQHTLSDLAEFMRHFRAIDMYRPYAITEFKLNSLE